MKPALGTLFFALAASATLATAPAAPDAAGLDRTIAALSAELPRAGSPAARDALTRRLADAYVLRARVHLDGGARDAALDAYDRALDLVPSHAVALVEAGWVCLESGRPERARSLAETALAKDAGYPHALALRGEILYREERLPDALADLEAAAAALPGDEGLRERLAKVRRELATERDYRRADSSNFTLRFDGSGDARLRTLLLDELERSLAELRREIEVGPIPPLSVIAYTRADFHDTLQLPAEVAGAFDGKVRLPVAGVTGITPALQRVIRHELAHALLHTRGNGRVPRWLHEGMAQLLEPRAIESSRAALRQEDGGRAAGLEPFSYARSHLFVAFLAEDYSRDRILWFVDLLAQNQPEEQAFERAFGLPLSSAIEAWNRWLSSRR